MRRILKCVHIYGLKRDVASETIEQFEFECGQPFQFGGNVDRTLEHKEQIDIALSMGFIPRLRTVEYQVMQSFSISTLKPLAGEGQSMLYLRLQSGHLCGSVVHRNRYTCRQNAGKGGKFEAVRRILRRRQRPRSRDAASGATPDGCRRESIGCPTVGPASISRACTSCGSDKSYNFTGMRPLTDRVCVCVT